MLTDDMQQQRQQQRQASGLEVSGLRAPTAADTEKLGSTSDLQFFASKLRDVCLAVDEVGRQLTAVLGDGGFGSEGGFGSGGLGAGGVRGEFSTESLDFLNRQLKAYLAAW